MNASQQAQLYIAKEVKRICEKNGIKYFIMAGSLLGAVRHGGFIPWDDDMDFGMERQEYDRFLNVCKTDLRPEFFVQTWDTEEHYAFPFGKVMLRDTVWIEDWAKRVDISHSIYVDIFPYDAIPNNLNERKWQNIKHQVYRQILLASNKYDSFVYKKGIKKVLFILMRFFGWIFPRELVKNKYKQLILNGRRDDSNEYFAFGIPYSYERGRMKKEWIDNLSTIKFEDDCFLAPTDTDAYLSFLYGDYMTPPPVVKRVNYHHIIKSNLGKFEIQG